MADQPSERAVLRAAYGVLGVIAEAVRELSGSPTGYAIDGHLYAAVSAAGMSFNAFIQALGTLEHLEVIKRGPAAHTHVIGPSYDRFMTLVNKI